MKGCPSVAVSRIDLHAAFQKYLDYFVVSKVGSHVKGCLAELNQLFQGERKHLFEGGRMKGQGGGVVKQKGVFVQRSINAFNERERPVGKDW